MSVPRLLAAIACAALLCLGTASQAALSLEDDEKLAAALEVLAQSADGEAGSVAAQIYAKPGYESADFEEFLSSFFSDHWLTEPLYHALAPQALTSPSEETRKRLQEALGSALVGSIDTSFRARLPDHLGPALVSDPALFEHLRTSLWLLADLAWEGDRLSSFSRRALTTRLARLIGTYPGVLRQEVKIDVVAQPRVAALRAQLFKILRDLPTPFDPAAFVADTGFTGAHAQIVRRHGVLVLDNQGFDTRQLDAIDQVLTAIPSSLHRITHISQYDLLGTRIDDRIEVPLHGSPGVNLFATPVEGGHGNAFPPDIEPKQDRFFCAVLQHELNHGVDELSVSKNPRFSQRRDELIRRAGTDPSRYLRSTVPPGFFRDQPQEFFASIANMYLSESAHTLDLALKRLQEGQPEPLDQFLFFADVYSQGRDSTLFFYQDEECNYSAYLVRLGRDGSGRIDRIAWPGGDRRFQLDRDGNVVP
jgi:hypothetical protein